MAEYEYKSASLRVRDDGEGRYFLHSFYSQTPKQGHGSTLLKCVKKALKKKGARKVTLWVAPFGPDAMSFDKTAAFYEKNGFRFAGRNQHMEYIPCKSGFVV